MARPLRLSDTASRRFDGDTQWDSSNNPVSRSRIPVSSSSSLDKVVNPGKAVSRASSLVPKTSAADSNSRKIVVGSSLVKVSNPAKVRTWTRDSNSSPASSKVTKVPANGRAAIARVQFVEQAIRGIG